MTIPSALLASCVTLALAILAATWKIGMTVGQLQRVIDDLLRSTGELKLDHTELRKEITHLRIDIELLKRKVEDK
jgi:regulator of replication initiation timing